MVLLMYFSWSFNKALILSSWLSDIDLIYLSVIMFLLFKLRFLSLNLEQSQEKKKNPELFPVFKDMGI